jgi:hypothetical protein
MKRRLISNLAALAIVLSVTISLWAQGASSLRGLVMDPQKAVIVNARVTLTDKDTGVSRVAVTSETGQYQFLQVRPGSYSLVIESPGFTVAKVDGIKLLVDTPRTLDVPLEVAANASAVNVVAETASLNAVDASMGNAFEERQVQSLPIQTRNAAALLSLQPGVTQNGEVLGARRDQNNITLDGIDINDNQNALSGLNGNASGNGFNAALPIPLDSVQEFRVTVAGSGAAEGHSSGGQVSLITRSGTNTLHGSAYEYNRNTAYIANNWFNNRSGLPRPQLIRNQFGASLGGPIKKDRIFYFANYERRLDHSQQTQSRTVPSESFKQGIVKFQTTNGLTYSMSPTDIVAADPNHIGASPAMLQLLKQYPVGNNPAGGADQGLNFSGFLFNAPVRLDYRTYVSRMDWIVDSAAKHTVSFRGTLSNQDQTNSPAQMPGQASASTLLADNRGFGVRYTATLSPSLTNTANIGLTRIGFGQTGASGTSLSFANISTLQSFTRAKSRINPTWDLSDDLTWTKHKHTVTAGVSVHLFNNTLVDYTNSYATYAFNRNQLVGLGADINATVLNVVAPGNTTLKLSNGSAVTSAMGDLLGVLTNGSIVYNYLKDGSTIPVGQPTNFDFIVHTTEFYLQDNWKLTPKLSINYGMRYMYSAPPYEAKGLQVAGFPTMDQYFANRVFAADNGIPGNQLAGGELLTFDVSGPANGKSNYYRPDKNNFAPRISVAYAASAKTVIRAGAGLVYDQYGSDLAANVATLGSMGLTSTQAFPVSYDFTTGPRVTNASLPGLPAAPQGGFPFTPPLNYAITSPLYGIYSDLVAPYSVLMNASVAHQFEHGFTLDVGYIGRLSRKNLLEQNVGTPLLYFKDKKSGMTFVQADTAMRLISDSGVTPAQVKSNPSLAATNPFVESMFGGLKDYYFPGSATANYYYSIYGMFAGSDLDNLHSLDRVKSAAFPNCIVATGCFTFFAPQISNGASWTNAGTGNYHALVVSLRRALRSGAGFDFNYTWSHSIDNASASASGSFSDRSTMIANAYRPGLGRNSSDFDLRHQFNANFLYSLPFGKGKMLLGGAPKWVDTVVNGWQVSGIITARSGLPTTISGTGAFSTNYNQGNQAIPAGPTPSTGAVMFDQLGNPSLFPKTTVTSAYKDNLPGGVGMRGIVRLPWQRNVDAAVTRTFRTPWERHTLQLRAEAFNLLNFVNFSTVSLSLSNPGTFGEFSAAQDARVLQLALRYSF